MFISATYAHYVTTANMTLTMASYDSEIAYTLTSSAVTAASTECPQDCIMQLSSLYLYNKNMTSGQENSKAF